MFGSLSTSLRRVVVLCVSVVVVLLVGVGVSQARSVSLSWQPSPEAFWAVDGAAITSLFHNGQCTQWAMQRRPDVVRAGVEAVVSRELAADRPEDIGDWDARNWPALARAAGIATGRVPRARALVVFAPGVEGAGSSGHIAFVQRVFADHSFEISEMHAPVLWRVTHRRLSAADGRRSGVTFIY